MQRPKVGLALGSGAIRGFAHFGVIRALEENDIPIDYVAGTSIGALIGSLYCCGADIKLIIKVLENIAAKHVVDFAMTKKGLIQGKKIEELLRLFVRPNNFEELKIPLSVVATDLVKGERVVFDKGDVISAVRASISIPGVFTPKEYNGMILADGAIIERMPIDVVKEMGADIVIGVDVGYRPGDDFAPKSITDVILQAMGIMELRLMQYSMDKCDVLICPDVGKLSPLWYESIDDYIKVGEDAAQEVIHKINMLVKGEIAT